MDPNASPLPDAAEATQTAPQPADSPSPPAEKVVSSILDTLREKRAHMGANADPLYLDVPGYNGALVVEYKWVPLSQISRTAQQLEQISEPSVQTVAAAADTLVACCQEIHVRQDDSLLPLSTDGIPVTFSDPRLAFALGYSAPDTARESAIRAFNNEYALIEQAKRVSQWLTDTSKKVNASYVGE